MDTHKDHVKPNLTRLRGLSNPLKVLWSFSPYNPHTMAQKGGRQKGAPQISLYNLYVWPNLCQLPTKMTSYSISKAHPQRI